MDGEGGGGRARGRAGGGGMAPITERMVRSRAEHNEGRLSNLEEVSLHQQNIERIEHLDKLCRNLKILYLQNNVIGKLQNLHRLKKLEYLNVAVNNLRRVENLQRCESLTKLDLTMNFLDKPGLLSLHSLQRNVHLRELYLTGNPCLDWAGCKPFVIATLPQLEKFEGKEIRPSERIAAQQDFGRWEAELRRDLVAQGIDPDEAAIVEDDYDEDDPVDEEYVGEDGKLYRPYTPATRLIEAREAEREKAEEDRKKRENTSKLFEGPAEKPRRTGFDAVVPGERVWNKNEGKWGFTIDESPDGRNLVLDVAVGKFLDTSLLDCDVQPKFVRVLVKGRLLQLTLEEEVAPDRSTAERNVHTGHLVVTMPKLTPTLVPEAGPSRPARFAPAAPERDAVRVRGIVNRAGDGPALRERSTTRAAGSESEDESASDDDDDDEPPPLT